MSGRSIPDALTVQQRKNNRKGRVFIDYMRNAYGQTAAGPYVVRARECAPVATPLDWSEALSKDLRPDSYTIENIFRRLAQKDDPWKDMDRRPQSLATATDRLGDITGRE